jgi:hypothetical protein
MERQTWREVRDHSHPPEGRKAYARVTLWYVSTHRRARWRIAPWIAVQVPCFTLASERSRVARVLSF